VLIAIGYGMGRKKGAVVQAFNVQNYSGYNIGVFALPFILNFVGPAGVAAICLFDVGNSLFVMGGTYAIASSILHKGEKAGVGTFLKTVFSSVTMDVYLVMTIVSLAHFTIPAGVLVFTNKIAMANGFLAMLMIGIGFELHMKRSQVAQIIRILLIRLLVGSIFAVLFFHAPFSYEVRVALVLLAFAPIPTSATAFTSKLNGDIALSSTLNSMAIVVSILMMTALLVFLHLV
jgi:predicted permease